MSQVHESRSYEVVITFEDGVWLVEAEGMDGVRSFGRTVGAAIEHIREAIAAAEDLSEWRDLDLSITVTSDAGALVLERLREATRKQEAASVARHEAVRSAIVALRRDGMSYRDIGVVIGLSHQRVAQIDSAARD